MFTVPDWVRSVGLLETIQPYRGGVGSCCCYVGVYKLVNWDCHSFDPPTGRVPHESSNTSPSPIDCSSVWTMYVPDIKPT